MNNSIESPILQFVLLCEPSSNLFFFFLLTHNWIKNFFFTLKGRWLLQLLQNGKRKLSTPSTLSNTHTQKTQADAFDLVRHLSIAQVVICSWFVRFGIFLFCYYITWHFSCPRFSVDMSREITLASSPFYFYSLPSRLKGTIGAPDRDAIEVGEMLAVASEHTPRLYRKGNERLSSLTVVRLKMRDVWRATLIGIVAKAGPMKCGGAPAISFKRWIEGAMKETWNAFVFYFF